MTEVRFIERTATGYPKIGSFHFSERKQAKSFANEYRARVPDAEILISVNYPELIMIQLVR